MKLQFHQRPYPDPPITMDAPPEVARLFRAAFPDYRGRKFRLALRATANMTDTYWDGGSRTQYVLVRIATAQTMPIPDLISGGYAPTARAALDRLSDWPIPDGCAIVAHSIFCGRDTGLTLTVRPDNLTAALPAHQE